VKRKCPDDGTCHHSCGNGSCFRVVFCEPFSDYNGTGEWSTGDLEENPIEELIPSIERDILS